MPGIPAFFAGKNVFLTGVTGFVGKVLVEKLLRSCPDVNAIYVLIREKKGLRGQDRLNAILSEKLFDTLRETFPESFEKVIFISGDLLEDQTIANEADKTMLLEKINVVIHSAASVKFSEPLRNSVAINLKATHKLLVLAQTMKNLHAFVHVSTAYSNCQLKEVREEVYPCTMCPLSLMSMCEWMDDDLLDRVCPKLLVDRPNTYTYTKAMAEKLVKDYSHGLPVAIVRPSIITGALAEPLPGWVDNLNGPNGLLVALGTGALTTLYTKLDCTADLIPVDFVANTILAAATRSQHGFKVYNCTSGMQNPITWRVFMEASVDIPLRYPTTSIVRYPQPRITSYKLVHQMRLFFGHYVPAQMIDILLRCARRRPILTRLYQRLANSMDLLEFFATNEWKFDNTNTRRLFNRLDASDKEQFNFNVLDIDWPNYVQSYCLGIREFLLKQDLSNLEQAKWHLQKFKYLSYATDTILVFGAWKTCSAILPCAEMIGLL